MFSPCLTFYTCRLLQIPQDSALRCHPPRVFSPPRFSVRSSSPWSSVTALAALPACALTLRDRGFLEHRARWRESVASVARNPAWPLRILRLLLDFYFPNLLPKFKFPPVSPQLPPETGNPRRPAMGGPSGWEAPLQGPYLPPTGVHRAPAEHLLESQMRIRKHFVRWGVFQSTMTHHTPHHGRLDSQGQHICVPPTLPRFFITEALTQCWPPCKGYLES